MKISFAYQSFKWGNSAKNNAGVTVVIIGLSSNVNKVKNPVLYGSGERKEVKEITPYLTSGNSVIVRKQATSISGLPTILFGSMPNDGGYLLLNDSDYAQIIQENPSISIYIRKFLGADEFIKGIKRYCFWIEDEDLSNAEKFLEIKRRIEKVREYRLSSKREATKKLAIKSHSFGEKRHKNKQGFVIPAVSSENRLYVPLGLVEGDTVCSNRLYEIYDGEVFILGLLMSKMHMVWLDSIGGKLETRFNYSAGLVYNTFPVPELSDRIKNQIEDAVMDILDIRDEEGGTLAELYGSPLAEKNPKPMNKRLQLAHERLDKIVEKAYRSKPFENDAERLELLLSMYQEMVKE